MCATVSHAAPPAGSPRSIGPAESAPATPPDNAGTPPPSLTSISSSTRAGFCRQTPGCPFGRPGRLGAADFSSGRRRNGAAGGGPRPYNSATLPCNAAISRYNATIVSACFSTNSINTPDWSFSLSTIARVIGVGVSIPVLMPNTGAGLFLSAP